MKRLSATSPAFGTRRHLQKLLDILLPAFCQLCSAPCREHLCNNCVGDLPQNNTACSRCDLPLLHAGLCAECQARSPAFDQIITAFQFAPPVSLLINRLKHQRQLYWVGVLCEPLVKRLQASYRERYLPDVLVPVPLHWRRQLVRGFNQTEVLARSLSKAFDIPLARSIKKIRITQKQQELSREERLRNLNNSFQCVADFKGKKVALIDDVVTTGATAETLARLLKKQGVAQVDVWALARAPKHL